MPLYRFDVVIPSVTALPEDVTVNTWHFFNGSPVLPSDFDNVRDMLFDFYDVEQATLNLAITDFMSNDAVGANWVVRAYDLSDPLPRAPVYTSGFTVTHLGNANPMPSEVALVLSIQAAPESGVPQARRRNRKYLGPFSVLGLEAPGRPSLPLMLTIGRAAKELLNAAQASLSWGWRVYSPTTDLDLEPVGGWVDNAWDTQRRRGLASSLREPWSETLPVD